jgi:hypothetical protein
MNRNKENIKMESKFIKNVMQKKQTKDNQHISGVAATIFGILLIIAILGAVILNDRVADLWIGLFVFGLTLVGTYILFALKVASQWANFMGCAALVCFGSPQSWTQSRPGSTTA